MLARVGLSSHVAGTGAGGVLSVGLSGYGGAHGTGMSKIEYSLNLIGGPFDGAGGMRWLDDGERPLPEQILVGCCPGDGTCGGRRAAACRREGVSHVYFWLLAETVLPARVTPYDLHDEHIAPDVLAPPKVIVGRADYVLADVMLSTRRAGEELVGAGAGVSDGVLVA